MEWIILIIVGYFLLQSGALNSLLGGITGTSVTSSIPVNVTGQTGTVNIPPQGYFQPANTAQIAQSATGLKVASQGVSAGLNIAQTALKSVSGAANAIPIVGAAVSALISAFAAKSAQRAKQATDENSAVAQAVPGWDAFIAAIANAYNTGQITATQAKTAIDAAWANFWTEVGPVIQPGRNGCKSGSVTQPSTVSFCGGNTYGAACCVGYDDLKNSNNNMKAALDQTEKTGKPSPATILPVFASKYGGINRPQYTITFIRNHN